MITIITRIFHCDLTFMFLFINKTNFIFLVYKIILSYELFKNKLYKLFFYCSYYLFYAYICTCEYVCEDSSYS